MPHGDDNRDTRSPTFRDLRGGDVLLRRPLSGEASVLAAAFESVELDDEQERTSRLLLRDEWSSLQAPAFLLPVWTKPSSQRDDF